MIHLFIELESKLNFGEFLTSKMTILMQKVVPLLSVRPSRAVKLELFEYILHSYSNT